ncbi:MAG: phosphoenolpyruvate--protein phosphotransferase [Firmicutes bacterium]|nr:phosphoenolpyruvate--protein phosphotransferase [Bacillota bacterium]
MEVKGIAAAAGYGLGYVFLLQDAKVEVVRKDLPQDAIETEVSRFEGAVRQAISELEVVRQTASEKMGEDAAAIFSAHIMMLEDPEYIGAITQKIRQTSVNAESVLEEVTREFVALFEGMDNEYLRERAADLKDVSGRLLRGLLGIKSMSLADSKGEVILCAHDLTPSDTAQLDRSKVAGFVTNVGGRTSHSAIMARTMGIPAVVGLKDIADKVQPGDFLIVDGNDGKVLVNPPEAVIEEYRQKQAKAIARKNEFEKLLNEKSVTRDGVHVEVAANIGNPDDAKSAANGGAEGVGLYRTEFLYMGRKELPSEEEQFKAYKEVAEVFGKRPVVIRTLDIGGDKELSYLEMPEEMNPFLGYRAIRLCLDRTDIFKTQLRAILRASSFGNIKMMYPMIATLSELRAANRILAEVKQELTGENISFNAQMEVGIMVEIPAAAVLAHQFAKEVDFFSIGTNDLVQYTLAVDRMNEKISYLYQPLNPSVLHLIQNVITAAHNEKKWVGMCGEMAGDLTAIPVLLGMGLDEFSMSASSMLPARALIRQLSKQDMVSIAKAVLEMDDAEAIRTYVEQRVPVIADFK